jgi:carbamoyltransferase
MPEYLLGLHEDSNSNAALFRDGRLISAVAEERLTRRKYEAGFPEQSIRLLLEMEGITLDEVDLVVAANRFHFLPRVLRLLGTSLPAFEHPLMGFGQKAHVTLQDFFYRSRVLQRLTEGFNRRALRRIFGKPVVLLDHHTAHAYSAYLTAGFPEALALTVDNFGDGFSATVHRCRKGLCAFLYGSSAMDSPGQYYGELAQILGHHPLQAGKMTGQAAYGDPWRLLPLVRELFALRQGGSDFTLPFIWDKSARGEPFRTLATEKRADVAAAGQRHFEEVMMRWVEAALDATGDENVVLAGGVFGNVRLNQLILELPQVANVFVHPGMSDAGLAVGAVLAWLARREGGLTPVEMETVLLGPAYGEERIEQALRAGGLSYTRPENMAEAAAELLVAGKVLARFDGRMEYGPRALGNRSILYQTQDPSVNDWLNKRLKRSEFMPFAPVTLVEHAAECYHNWEGARAATRFMTISLHCTDYMKRVSPGVVHVDGTARPQVLGREDNPGYYDILQAYHARTGIPSLINTSFNLHGEPIVCTPEDAVRSFLNGHLDVLAIGPFLASVSR